MKFVTHTISTKTKPKTLSEVFKAAQTRAALNKTASAKQDTKVASKVEEPEVVVKVAEEDKKKGGASDEAESSGQLKVEPLHQEGESTNQEKVHTNKKESAEVAATKAAESPAGKAVKEKDEGESSGQLKVEPLHQEGESTGDKPGDLDTQKSDKKKAKVQQKVNKKAGFTRISELTAEEKDFLRGVWSNFWTKKFIDAILGAGPGAGKN
jgi:hypothetical protein